MKITKNLKGSRKHGCENISITATISNQREAAARELAWILGYPEDDLGKVIDEYCWTIPDALGDLPSDLEGRTWSNEQECRQVAARVAERGFSRKAIPGFSFGKNANSTG